MPRTADIPPAYLLDRYRTWRRTRFEPDHAWYARLAREGQRPRAMVIACCDSRIDPTALFGGEPGDLFVVRNVAGLVPPFAPDHAHHGTSAAVEFAVCVLKVAHIVVLGHSNCGGVAACHDMCSGERETPGSFISRWIDILRPGYERLDPSLDTREARLAALEREGVLVSLRNLESFPFVEEALKRGELSLHGGWIDIGAGALHAFDRTSRRFSPVPD
jgi:carbonic anhydrase